MHDENIVSRHSRRFPKGPIKDTERKKQSSTRSVEKWLIYLELFSMDIIVKILSHSYQVSVGILGIALCLSVVIPGEIVLGQEVGSHVQESEMVAGKNPNPGKLKAKRWTVPCEREDGTKGIFRVSSNVTVEVSSLEFESDAEADDMVAKPPSPNLHAEISEEDSEDEDPFGNPTLKCGKLLTLLAIFASGEFQSP